MTNLIFLLDKVEKVSCSKGNYACEGLIGSKGIPGDIALLIHYVYLGILVVVPLLLIIFGMIELAKAVTAQKDDEIKKAQSGFAKKLIVAVLVILVASIVGWVVDFASSTQGGDKGVMQCIEAIIGGKCGN